MHVWTRSGELTDAVARYRFVNAGKSYFIPHMLYNGGYSGHRVDQMFRRARRSMGIIPQSRYHKGWAKQKYG